MCDTDMQSTLSYSLLVINLYYYMQVLPLAYAMLSKRKGASKKYSTST